MTKEQLDRANDISMRINNVKGKLRSLKTAQRWEDNELRRCCADGDIEYHIYLEDIQAVRTLINILCCKYEEKLEELEKEFEEL